MIGLADFIGLANFEALAIKVKESKTSVLLNEMDLAGFAVEHDRMYHNEDPPPRLARWLASLWGQSTTHGVNVLARMAEIFSDEDIRPDVPLSLYKAVMETDDPRYALRLATDYEFRRQELGEEFAAIDKKGTWSSSDLRRHYDIQKGRHYTSAIKATVKVTTWDPATGGFGVIGFPVSGDMPEWVLVAVRERLEKESNDRTDS